MNAQLVIAVIEGSARDKRESIKAARFVAELAGQQPDVEVIFADPKEFSFPNDGNDREGRDPRYTALVERADAFFIVTPEYNHSYPGSLKRMLDSEYEAYFYKPVALAGVSNGGWGGTRAVESLLPVMRSLGLMPLPSTTYFPRVQDIFASDGGFSNEQARKYYTGSVGYQLQELIWVARALKVGREAHAATGV